MREKKITREDEKKRNMTEGEEKGKGKRKDWLEERVEEDGGGNIGKQWKGGGEAEEGRHREKVREEDWGNARWDEMRRKWRDRAGWGRPEGRVGAGRG